MKSTIARNCPLEYMSRSYSKPKFGEGDVVLFKDENGTTDGVIMDVLAPFEVYVIRSRDNREVVKDFNNVYQF